MVLPRTTCAEDRRVRGRRLRPRARRWQGCAICSRVEHADQPVEHLRGGPIGSVRRESKLRSLAIVSREGAAAYRVRAYLSAQVVRGKTMIAWVWDVYDGDQQRALRLSGEEAAGKSGRDPWGAADDLVLRKSRRQASAAFPA